MPVPISENSTAILRAFASSWESCIKEYKARRINSERCLQAYLFHFLTKQLGNKFQIFVEATVRIPTDEGPNNYKRVAIDTLICVDDVVYAAIELKYSPKGQSKESGIRKDLLSLSHVKNRRSKADKLVIEMPRYRSNDVGKQLSVNKSVRLIFAAFFKDSGRRVRPDAFWESHRPSTGRWKKVKKTMPQRLGIALAYTNEVGGANPELFGPAFT